MKNSHRFHSSADALSPSTWGHRTAWGGLRRHPCFSQGGEV